jgi:GNAT superfamily N-acetyltransferase
MKTTCRPYDPATDFLRIRTFLSETFALYQGPFNWLIDHWNFCRYFAAPVHTFYTARSFSVPTLTVPPLRDEVAAWEKTVAVWENERGEIVGVANTEDEEPGEVWFQIHPDYAALYEEMVIHSEAHLADRVGETAFVKLYVNRGSALEEVARARGYRKLDTDQVYLECAVPDAPAPELPPGFVLKSVAEEDDPRRRAMAKAFAFAGHEGPSGWAPAAAWVEMQQAPDYRADLDLFIVAPNGDYAAFCTIWADVANHYANFEPVGTHVDYQGQGLGRALLLEGFRRMARHGAQRSFMNSGNPFYRKLGFQPTDAAVCPWIRYFHV